MFCGYCLFIKFLMGFWQNKYLLLRSSFFRKIYILINVRMLPWGIIRMTTASEDKVKNLEENIKKIQEELKNLGGELDNFKEIARHLMPSPGDIPELKGIDIYGESIQLINSVGGDHIIYIDFKKRYDLDARIQNTKKIEIKKNLELNKKRAGILVADVAGHKITDASLAGQLHQAFLTGVLYELDMYGEITTKLFENINTRFYNSSSVTKNITMLYGEISKDGKFRFLSAAHQPPIVFSNEYNKIVKIGKDRLISYLPIGTAPSEVDVDINRQQSLIGYKKKYSVNEINLMNHGDLLILHTDGLPDHFMESDQLPDHLKESDQYVDGLQQKREEYFKEKLESKLKEFKLLSSKEIFYEIKKYLFEFDLKQKDDISYVIIKKV